MESVIDILRRRVSLAIGRAVGLQDYDPVIRAAADERFGDYQANGIMALAKKLGKNPRALAGQVIELLEIDDICLEPEVAGPGFINFRLKNQFLEKRLVDMHSDTCGRFGIEKSRKPETVVVDFSSPNIAKQMHVGHLRSTIIGDCICRLLEFAGHKVIRQNHIGDWGTQFGMLIAFLREQRQQGQSDSIRIDNLEQFYRNAKTKFDSDPAFADKARKQVVALQGHNETAVRVWRHIVDESRRHYQPLYDILAVNLHKENECGESFYAGMLSDVVKELKDKGIAVESEGAVCVFPPGFVGKDGSPLPLIIQKNDGAYLYATTDLAALRYRVRQLKADRIIYVTDSRQKLHFEMLFATARMAGWADNVKLEHVMFGMVLGQDGRPLKTRSGENVRLKELLDEAVQRAGKIVQQKNPDLDDHEKSSIARAVGIGAVKYADYANNRISDYIFSFDRMLAMDGNTAPYMQYACARVRSIERKAFERSIDYRRQLADIDNISIDETEEIELAKQLVRYAEAVDAAVSECMPGFLTTYLYELAQRFSGFYNACPVLDSDNAKRRTRLLLCDLTAGIISHGLAELLGIEAVERM